MTGTILNGIGGRQILGEVVRELRSQYIRGTSPSGLARYLSSLNVPNDLISSYIEKAFGVVAISAVVCRWRADGTGLIPHERLDQFAGPRIDRNREKWQYDVYPELMRKRDRLVFMEFASANGFFLIVRGANPFSGQFVGREGYRLFPPELPCVSRFVPPNEGLVVAGAKDRRLASLLAASTPALSYEDYVEMLQERGLSVAGFEDGCIVRDAVGNSFYEPYRLHGVYEKQTGANAWTGAAGERLRAELNRRLGAELIACGPHDVWEYRNDRERAGALYGPQPAVILFEPNGDAENLTDIPGMRRFYRWFGINWDAIYPKHTGDSEEASR